MGKSITAKNGHERVTTDRDNNKHLQFFMNGQWRHSDKCKQLANKDCGVKAVKNSQPRQLSLFNKLKDLGFNGIKKNDG